LCDGARAEPLLWDTSRTRARVLPRASGVGLESNPGKIQPQTVTLAILKQKFSCESSAD
jgi:hypothetical protein